MIGRFAAATILLCACLALGSCASFSGAVADNWPTWAGGMPKDVPPRPGAPGYEAFIEHQQGKNTAAGATGAVPAQGVSAPDAPPPAANQADRSAVQGGLY